MIASHPIVYLVVPRRVVIRIGDVEERIRAPPPKNVERLFIIVSSPDYLLSHVYITLIIG